MSYDALGYYRILNATPETDAETLKLNYREMAKKWHPDYNTDQGAIEIFQKLSVAYETLQDEHKHLVYDMLSLVYGEADYPDIETIEPFMSCKGVSLRALNITDVRGLIVKASESRSKYVCDYAEAVRLELRKSVLNWLLGWWSPTAFFKNISALGSNLKSVNSPADNLRLLVHNAVAYYQRKNLPFAVQSAVQALSYASPEARLVLQRFIAVLDTRVSRPQAWNFGMLRLVQLLVPAVLVIAASLPYSARYISEADLMKYFSQKKEISYYQEVNMGGTRGRTVDDVVVGKIINIPVDKGDERKLYHLNADAKIMYGPADDFDVLKNLPQGTTVRLTGRSPDDIWARVMIDNGEMGFIRLEMLRPGIGSPISEYSEIILHR